MSGKTGAAPARAKVARGRWSEVLLVCAKCGKRQGLGRGEMRKRLKRAAKAVPDARDFGGKARGPRLRVAEVGCLGICPGKGVVAATAAGLSQGRVVVLDPAVAGEAALRALLPARPVAAAEGLGEA